MKEGIAYTGIPSAEELSSCAGIPTRERMAKGPVAVIECIQCIPCNPCEMACPTGAISLGGAISNAPKLDGDKCIGCGKCVARCPGQAITVLNLAYSADKATLDFPYEFLPLPAEGDTVRAVNRAGAPVCEAAVLSVRKPKENDGTCVIRIAFPAEYAGEVKSIERLEREV
ncbi:MAG: NADH-quinone oxidoreductase subunit I [Oscillospiraceae bacterium]